MIISRHGLNATEAELPPGWDKAPLGDILPLSYGKGLTTKHRNAAGDVPVYGSSGEVGRHDEALTSGPAIVVGRKGSAGAVYFCNRPCYPIDTVYFTQSEHLDLRMYAYMLDFLDLETRDQSTAIPSLSRDSYNPISVPVPPINEQRRIVEKIDELFSDIEQGEAALRRAKTLLQRYRQAVLKAAVTGELTRDWREQHRGEIGTGEQLLARILEARRAAWEKAELAKMAAKGHRPKDDSWKRRYKEPVPPDTSDLPELPEGWAWARLPMLGEFGRGKSKHRPRNDPRLYGGEYPFIQTGEVRRSNGRITTYAATYNEDGLAQSKMWPSGTLCITIAANIAETGILEFAACFPDSVVGLVADRGVVTEYVE